MLGKLFEKASYIKAKITRDELEIALNEATTEDNWQASTAVLHEIASSAYDKEKWKRIFEFLWEKLKNNKKWAKILKSLNVVEFLLKNGPHFAVNQIRYDLRMFKTFGSFQEYEGSVDRGAPIRERAKSIVDLLQNEELLEDERLRAHQIRQKMSHLTGNNGYGSGKDSKSNNMPKYQSYNNQTFHVEDNGYYNYGKGNYGDLADEKKYDHDYFENINRFKDADKPKAVQQPIKSNPQPQPQSQPQQPQSSPIVEKKQPARNTGKPTFSTMTAQLLKGNKKVEKVQKASDVVKPDLGYKKEEGLLDLEGDFFSSKYHFEEEPAPQNTGAAETNNIQPESHVDANEPIVAKPIETVTTTNNFMNELNGFNFFGGADKENKPVVPSKQEAQPAFIESKGNISRPTEQSNGLSPSKAPQLNNEPPMAGQPFHNGQPSYPGYPYQPHVPSYNPYDPYSNQRYYQQYPTNPYQQPYLSYNAPPAYSHTPYNPYQNLPPSNSISLSVNTEVKSVVPEVKSQNTSKNVSNSSDMNFNDMSDLMKDISSSGVKKETPKKDVNNNIKIDPWAW